MTGFGELLGALVGLSLAMVVSAFGIIWLISFIHTLLHRIDK